MSDKPYTAADVMADHARGWQRLTDELAEARAEIAKLRAFALAIRSIVIDLRMGQEAIVAIGMAFEQSGAMDANGHIIGNPTALLTGEGRGEG